jgi:hypothetical protein
MVKCFEVLADFGVMMYVYYGAKRLRHHRLTLHIGRKIRDFERIQKKAKLAEKMARIEAAIDIGDNCIDGEVGSEIRDNEETPAAEKVDKMGIVQQVKLALDKCKNMCEDAGHEVIRHGECRDKIQG